MKDFDKHEVYGLNCPAKGCRFEGDTGWALHGHIYRKSMIDEEHKSVFVKLRSRADKIRNDKTKSRY